MMTETSARSDMTLSLNSPAVWVLIFDQYPVAAALEESKDASALTPAAHTKTEGVFDRLDLESTCFEQFLLQEVRSEVQPVDVFGGESAFVKLAEMMSASGQTASLVDLTIDGVLTKDSADDEAMESALLRCGIPLQTAIRLDCSTSNETPPMGDRNKNDDAFRSNLVWMEAGSGSTANPLTASKSILNFVMQRMQLRALQDEKRPVLIVTFRKGDSCDVREPLKFGIAENRMHVPLWIQPTIDHACRVQSLAGSFDLLPTIAKFLGSTSVENEFRPPEVTQTADSSEHVATAALPLSSAPRCLAFLCGAPQVCPDRLLKLHGDGWMAARTEEFLLVIAAHNQSGAKKTESGGDDSEEPSRRLFVKPEDRFNINDVIGTYATVAEELALLIT